MGQLGAMLSHRGVMLGDYLGPMLGRLGPAWSQVGPMLGHLGAILGRCWPYVGAGSPLSEPYLDPGSSHLGRRWPYVGTKAVKMSSFPFRPPS